MTDELDLMVVGKFVAVQGLKGEVRVNPRSDFPERFTKPGPRWMRISNYKPQQIQLLGGRRLPGKSLYVVRLAGVDSRKVAAGLIGANLLVLSSDRPELSDDEFHFLDLVGLEVRLEPAANPIGHVVDLISGGNDLLEIKLLEGRKVLVPLVKAIVPEVHLLQRWILLNPPPGLLEL